MIAQDPNGTMVLQKPHTLPDGRFDEYRGTLRGLTVTLSHPVTALSNTNKKVPTKVLQEWGRKGLTSRLVLQLSPDGQRLSGKHESARITYNKRTLAIIKITPNEKSIVLTRKAPDSAAGLTNKPPPVDQPPIDEEVAELWRRALAAKEDWIRARNALKVILRRANEEEQRAWRAAFRQTDAQHDLDDLGRVDVIRRDPVWRQQFDNARLAREQAEVDLRIANRLAIKTHNIVSEARAEEDAARSEAVRARNAAIEAARRARPR